MKCLSTILIAALMASGIYAGTLTAAEQETEAKQTVEAFMKADPGLGKFMDSAVGYAVFPTVGKGAVGIGGAHGKGLLYEKKKLIGTASMTQVTIGLQLGGQSYSELIFFENQETLAQFKKNKLAFSAQVSAVAAASGASANAKYQLGVAVFTLAKGGLMYEASLGGQKFKFKEIPAK